MVSLARKSLSILVSLALIFSLSPFAKVATTPAYAETTAELSSIIYNNEMYTTIYTQGGAVVDTNDPDVLADASAMADQVSTVGKDAVLTVHFRLASIIANDGTSGVQENTTYTQTLPTQLTPNDDEITAFFNTGDIEATGQIIEQKTLNVNFENVTDRVDISGAFQYTATIAGDPTAGSTVNVTGTPGGDLEFTITPEAQPEEPSTYALELTGTQTTEANLQWTVTATNIGDSFNYGAIEVTLADAQGFLISSAEKTLTMVIDGETLTATGSGSNFAFSNGVTVTFDSAAKDSLQSSAETVTAKATINIPNRVNPKSIAVTIPAIAYDDYKYDGQTANYNASAKLTEGIALNDITADKKTTAQYGNFSSPTVSLSAGDANPYDSYAYTNKEIKSYAISESTSHTGNYYWVEYEPQTYNDSKSVYYISNKSFLPGNSLSSSSTTSTDASFTTSYGPGTRLVGKYGEVTDWSFATVLTSSSVASVSAVLDALNTTDVKLAYQIMNVFQSISGSDQLVVYKSSTLVNGKTPYIIVDPQTNEIAKRSQSKGWTEFVEDNGSAKAGTWKLHIFNDPASQLYASSYQEQGVVHGDDNNQSDNTTTGSVKDTVRVGNAGTNNTSSHSSESGTTINRHRLSKMDAVRVDDDTIFWEMTIPVKQLTNIQNGGMFYALTGQGLYISSGNSFYLDNQELYPNNLYVKKQNVSSGDVWQTLSQSWSSTSSYTGATINDMNERSTLSTENGEYMFYTGFNTNLNSSEFLASDGTITIGYSTQVSGDYSSNNRYLTGYYSIGEVAFREGDVTRLASSDAATLLKGQDSAGAQAQFPFKISASASTTYPQLAKEGVVDKDATSGADATAGTTKIDWTLNISGLENLTGGHIGSPYFSNSNDVFYGYYNGRIYVGDSMKNSTATNSAGTTISDASVGANTHVTSMFGNGISASEFGNGGGCGPIPYMRTKDGKTSLYGDTNWKKYNQSTGQWESTSSTNYWKPNEKGIYHVTLTASQTNNETNPFEVYVFYSGDMGTSIRQAFGQSIDGILDLNNSIFEQSIVVEFDGLEHATNNTFTNGIRYATEMSDSALMTSAGSNGTNGLIANIRNAATCSSWSRANKSPVMSEISKTISADISIFKSTPAYVAKNGEPREEVEYTLRVQTNNDAATYVEVEDYITKFLDTASAEGTEASTDLSTLMKYLSVDKDSIVIKQVDAYGDPIKTNGTVYENGKFQTDWATDSSIEFDKTKAGSSQDGFLFKLHIDNDGSAESDKIYPGSVFEITYKLKLNMDGDDADSMGYRNENSYLGGQLEIYNNASATRDTNSTENPTLSVTCEGDIEATYLENPNVIKTPIETASDGTKTTWLFSDWTGSAGKEALEINVTDVVTANITAYKATTAQKQQLANLMAQYLKASNIKVYLTDEEVTKSNYASQTPVVTADTLSATQTKTADGITYTLTPIAAGTYTEDGTTAVSAPGFSLSAAKLDRETYLTAVYDIDFDKAGFFKEAKEKGLVDDHGYVTGTTSTITFSIDNLARSGDSDASATSGRTQIKESTLSKSVNANSSDGSATWSLTGYTGRTGNSTNTVFTDQLKFDGNASSAASASTSIEADSVTVKAGSTTLTKDTDYTVSVENKTKLTVTISKELAENTYVYITYKTTLDKDAFVAALNGSNDTDYKITNTAEMDLNGTKASATKDGEFKPTFPITISKTNESTSDSEAAYKVTFNSGSVKRENVVISDSLDKDKTSAEALDAIFINSIKFNIGGTEYTKDNLPEGYTLTSNNGDWKLEINSIDANTTIEVSYTLWIDRDKYDGELGKSLNLYNNVNVTTKDGSEGSSSVKGSITVNPDVKKTGEVISEKSDDGNPIMKWTFDVNLTYQYKTQEELEALKNVVIKDKLDSRLKYLEVKGTTFSPASGDLSSKLADNNTLEITVDKPENNSVFTVTFYTEVAGSIDEIENAVDLVIDGEKVSGDKFTTPKVVAVAEYGYITSATVPVWAATGLKTVDGAEPGDNTFKFILEDESGNKTTVENKADGTIDFGDVKFKKTPVAGEYKFKIYEDASSVDNSKFTADTTSYDVTVTVSKTDNVYTAKAAVDGSAFEKATFDNKTVPPTPDNPDNPNTPENPDNPNTPENPESPETPETPEESQPKVLSPTGDPLLPIVIGVGIVGALAIITTVLVRRKH